MSVRSEKGMRWFKWTLMIVGTGSAVKVLFAFGAHDSGNKIAIALFQFVGGTIFFGGIAYLLGWLAGAEGQSAAGFTPVGGSNDQRKTSEALPKAEEKAATAISSNVRSRSDETQDAPSIQADTHTQIESSSASHRFADEDFWAQALRECESDLRRPGLWAKSFADAGGNEAAAKANYLKWRAAQIADEHADRVRALEAERCELERRAQADQLMEEQRKYESLPKGNCPSCGSIILLDATLCSKCRATFGQYSSWKVNPIKET